MSQLSEEQQPEPTIRTGGEDLSIFEIMQRYRNDGSCEYVIQDALRRLSLLDSDSQAVGRRGRREPYSEECRAAITELEQRFEAEEVELCSIEYVYQRENYVANAMRDKCVEKLKEMLSAWKYTDEEVIAALESLTLDQVKPGVM